MPRSYVKHGLTPDDPKRWHPLYRTWLMMKQRCGNPRFPKYASYGGRGIAVCQRWLHDFGAVLADVGTRPSPRHTLERVDNDGPYSPENVTWALPQRQGRNKRNNVKVSYRGETLCLIEWAERTGIDISTLSYRFRRGWSPEAALTTPPKYGNRQR